MWVPRAQRLPCCSLSCPKGGGERHPPPPRNVLPCEWAALPWGAKHPLGCSIAKRGWPCSVSAGRASRGGLLAKQGVAAGPAGCPVPNARVGAMRCLHGAGLWPCGAAHHTAPPCQPREWQGEKQPGSNQFSLSAFIYLRLRVNTLIFL